MYGVDTVDRLLQIGKTLTYKKGEIIYRPTDLDGQLFIIKSGMVHVYTIEESGEIKVHIVYGANEIFPISWVIKRKPLNVFYEALTDCEITKVNGDVAIDIMKEDATACFAMLEQTIKQFVMYSARVDNLEYKFVRERIAYSLLFLGRRFGKEEGEHITMHRFSQDLIANTSNVSRENVSRELKRFERLGYIDYKFGFLKILNKHALRKELAHEDTPLFIDDI